MMIIIPKGKKKKEEKEQFQLTKCQSRVRTTFRKWKIE